MLLQQLVAGINVISNLDSLKMSIPVVVLNNFELDLQYLSEGILLSRFLEGLIRGPCI